VIWTGVVSIVAAYIVKATIGLRHPEVAEREGLDITDHGERAYNS
jgi:Amt family ammonium transporter